MATGDFFCESRAMKTHLTGLVVVLALVSGAALGKVKPTLVLDEKSRDALVVVEISPVVDVVDLGLNLSTYEKETKEFTSNSFKGQTLLQAVKGKKEAPRYLVGVVRGGETYIAHEMS